MSSSMGGYQGMQGPSGLGGPTGGSSGLKGTGYKNVTTTNYTPEMMELFKQMFGQVSPDSYTSRLASGDQSMFDEMEQPAMNQFNQLQGNMASRFSGMGSGARNSSGFQNSMGQAGADFAGQLASQRQGLQRQGIQDLMGMSNTLLNQKPYENSLMAKQKPFWQELLASGAEGAGKAATMALMM